MIQSAATQTTCVAAVPRMIKKTISTPSKQIKNSTYLIQPVTNYIHEMHVILAHVRFC